MSLSRVDTSQVKGWYLYGAPAQWCTGSKNVTFSNRVGESKRATARVPMQLSLQLSPVARDCVPARFDQRYPDV